MPKSQSTSRPNGSVPSADNPAIHRSNDMKRKPTSISMEDIMFGELKVAKKKKNVLEE